MSANPITNPEAWDALVIAGDYTPGLAKVKSSRAHKWDEKKGKGAQGSTLTYAGHDLATVDITLRFWEAEQYDEFEAKVGQWLPDPKNPKALDVVHPQLELLKIRSIVMLEISGVEVSDDGEMTVTIKAKEFLKPTPAGGTPSGSRAGSRKPGDAPPNALTEQEKQLAALLEEAKRPL